MDSPPPDPSPLDALLVELLERVDRGWSTERALKGLCEEHPQHAADLRDSVDVLGRAGLIGAGCGEGFPERLGDFRLIERLGSGGMGVVYLAEQLGLGRRVALKLLRPGERYFGPSRARFRREVAAVARLAHPGIVAVHTVGEEEGLPFLAMEFVAGISLDQVLDAVATRRPQELSARDMREVVARRLGELEVAGPFAWDERFWSGSWVELCLRIARTVAEALEHAHTRGVLHRDLKPSNVMVTPEGRVVLLDFGLASLSDADRLTRSGAQLGSLPYMPPEQVEGGGHVPDDAGDVYGVGVTLYELLALRPPWKGKAGELARRITAGGAPAIRSLNPSVSADAESVVAVAMEVDPRRRYGSAAALARDLTNVLELRPIEARPAGAWVRARRWARRTPGAASAAVLAVLLVVGGPLGYAWLEHRRRVEAQELLGQASLAVGRLYTLGVRNHGDPQPDDLPDSVSRRIVSDLVGFYAGLLEHDPDNRELAQEYARVLVSHASFLADGEGRARSLAALDDATRELEGFLELHPDSGPLRIERARIEGVRSYAHHARGEYREALLTAERAVRRYDALVEEDAEDPRRLFGLTWALWRQARALGETGELGEARAVLEEVLRHESRLSNDFLGYSYDPARVENTRNDLGVVLRRLGDLPASERVHRTALDRLLTIHESGDDSRFVRTEIARSRQGLAHALVGLGRPETAREHLERATDIMETVVATVGLLPDRAILVEVQIDLGELLATLEDPAASRVLRQARERAEEYFRDAEPDTPEHALLERARE